MSSHPPSRAAAGVDPSFLERLRSGRTVHNGASQSWEPRFTQTCNEGRAYPVVSLGPLSFNRWRILKSPEEYNLLAECVEDLLRLSFLTVRLKSSLQSREVRMLGQGAVADQILEVVRAHPGCAMDELTEHLPELHWSTVFVEVDRLNREGRLRLTKSHSGFLMKLHAI